MTDVLKRVMTATLAMQRYSWEQGTVAQAFLELGERDAAIAMALEGAYRQVPDGRCAMIGAQRAVTDPCAIGEALIYAFEKTRDAELSLALEKLLSWAKQSAPRNENGIVYHLDDSPEFWVDSIYMLPPFLARAGLYDEAVKQIDGYAGALYLPEKKLFGHIWHDGEKRFIRRDAWGVGNGWAMAGMTRVIRLLPDAYADRKSRLIELVKTVLYSALSFQREDGLFHDVLDDKTTFVETNFAQMAAYVIYRGVKDKWLDEGLIEIAEKMRGAAFEKLDIYGRVRGVCGAPSFDKPGFAPEGQAFFLLMEAARRDILGM